MTFRPIKSEQRLHIWARCFLATTQKDVNQLLELFPAIQGRGISPHAYAAALETLNAISGRHDC